MKHFRNTCSTYGCNNKLAYLADPPNFICCLIANKFNIHYISKTPVWAIQHCLSALKNSQKYYSLEISNPVELLTAADGAYIICGLLNPNCVATKSLLHIHEHPCDPSYNMGSQNVCQNKIPGVVLYLPSNGTYCLTNFTSDTSQL